MRAKENIAIVAAFVALALCVGGYLALDLSRKGMAAGDIDDPLGMVLIDIQSGDTAQMYNVRSYGVYVLAVTDESPAMEAGLASGDRILSLNGQKVSTTGELTDLMFWTFVRKR